MTNYPLRCEIQAESAKIVKVCGNDVVEDKKAAEEKKKEEGKRSFWGKKDKEPELDPSLQQKLEDADELEQFAIASKRKGTRNLLLEQIMRIREEVHREKEEFEKRKKVRFSRDCQGKNGCDVCSRLGADVDDGCLAKHHGEVCGTCGPF
jgi:hypothetical protein